MFFHGFDPNDPEEDPRLKSCLLRGAMLLAVLFIIPSLNYSGFCWSKMRYLSDEEKFRMIFDRLSKRDTLPIETEDRGTQYYEQIKYESFEDYMEKNPDCCAIDPGGPYDLPPDKFIDRITGLNNGEVIVMNYIVRYFDENGEVKSQKRELVTVLQNCGGSTFDR